MSRVRTAFVALLLLVLAVPFVLRGVPASAASGDGNDQGSDNEHGHVVGANISYFDTRDYTEGHRDAKGASRTAATGGNLVNQGGGKVMETPTVYVIFWGWSASDPARNYVKGFFNAAAGTSWLKSVTQYCDGIPAGTAVCGGAGSIYGGLLAQANVTFIEDTSAVPSRPSQSAIASIAAKWAAKNGTGPDRLYMVFTPHGKSMRGFGTSWCGWHSALSSNTPYAYIPYEPDAGRSCGQNFVNAGTAGTYDGFGIVGGHELAEANSDPLLNAWYDNSGAENGDKCAWLAPSTGGSGNLPGGYAVQSLWSNVGSKCVMSYP